MQAKPKAGPAEPDGLEWLIRKGRLTDPRKAAAMFYRKAFRDAGHVSISSGLGALTRVDGGSHGSGAHAMLITSLDSFRQVAAIRGEVLRGQDDLLTVTDGVVGVGHTLRYLAGGDGHRAKDLEAVLGVALDLIDSHLTNVHEREHLSPTARITPTR